MHVPKIRFDEHWRLNRILCIMIAWHRRKRLQSDVYDVQPP
jgi:hypothetical protein